MKALAALGLAVGLAAVAALVGVFLGLAPVAATTPHWGATQWVLHTAMERAVRREARRIAVPDDLDDPARVRAGASAYDAMCAGCHGAPGAPAGILAEGLLPPPPELAREAGAWSAAELFWITKHGVRMTGMPAFGPTHSDEELWDVVALLRRLPELSSAAWGDLTGETGGDDGHGHDHGGAGGGAHAH